MLDDTASRQPHGSFQQAIGDRRAVLQETGLLPGAQRHVGPGSSHTAWSNPQKTCVKMEGRTSTWEWAVLQKRRWLAEPGRSVRLRMWSLAEVVM